MNPRMKYFVVPFVTMAAVLFFGCGDPIPVGEMAAARYQISQAVTVKAEKYAPQQLKEAVELLLLCHDNVKADKFDDAKKNAEEAQKKAQEAYDVSLPLLAQDALGVAEKSLKDADSCYAAELANADYAAASEKLNHAKGLYESKSFYPSYLEALEADNLAKTARSLALSKKGSLKDAIDDVNETIARAEKLNAPAVSAEKLSIAKDNSAKALDAYNLLSIKEGFAAAEIAKTAADEAYLESLKAAAAANIDKAAAMIADVEKSQGSAGAKDEIAGAKESLANARSLYDGGKFSESIPASDEALRLAAIAADVTLKSGAAAVAANKTAEPEQPGSVSEENGYDIYVVKYFKDRARDCLWFIAKKFYNDPKKWPVIFKANRDQIKNPDVIRPGWKLKIPKTQDNTAQTAPSEPAQEKNPAENADPASDQEK